MNVHLQLSVLDHMIWFPGCTASPIDCSSEYTGLTGSHKLSLLWSGLMNSVNSASARITLKSLLPAKNCCNVRTGGSLLPTFATCFAVRTCLSTSPIPPCAMLKSELHTVQLAYVSPTVDFLITGYFNAYSARYFYKTRGFFFFSFSSSASEADSRSAILTN